MTPAELLALAQQLLYDCCDPVTGESLYPGQSSYACVEDVEAAALYLRACAEAEPVATVPHGWKLVPIAPTPEMLATTSWPGCAATDYAHMLAAAPQPPSAQADAIEAAEKAEPVAWLEGPYGEFRANPGYRIAAPQSVAWSIPLYAGTPEES